MKFAFLLFPIVLAACTTPETVLKNEETGQIARCGGNVAYAGVLYPFMKAADSQCVSDYTEQGFRRVKGEFNDSAKGTQR